MMRKAMTMLGMWLMVAALMGAAKAETHAISIKNGKCTPAKLTLAVGDSIEITNDDNKDHRIQSDDGTFDSGKLKPGESYKFKFTKAGTFTYACTLHPREKGSVVVKKKG
jgi:plastocyanin